MMVAAVLDKTQKRCAKCGIVKDLSEFYRDRNSKDGKKNQCRNCILEYQRFHRELMRNGGEKREAGSTAIVRRLLEVEGIPITKGKDIGFPHVDLSAWGCIPIEAKGSKNYALYDECPKFLWMFTANQKLRGFPLGTIIVFCGKLQNAPDRVFVVPSNAEWLVGRNGSMKRKGLSVSFRSNNYRSRENQALLSQYENAFHIIEKARQECSERLRSAA